MQLSLFEWDLIAVGSGYQALAELNFVEAERCFLSVLKRRKFKAIPLVSTGITAICGFVCLNTSTTCWPINLVSFSRPISVLAISSSCSVNSA